MAIARRLSRSRSFCVASRRRLADPVAMCVLALLPTGKATSQPTSPTAAAHAASVSDAGGMVDPRHDYAAFVAEAAQRFGLAQDWIWTVMRVESAGHPHVVSRAGAIGLMQLMPITWASLASRHGLGSDPFDIRANILAGAAYLRAMLDRYGDLSTALAAYNAGPARVDGWRAGTQSLPAETVAYVARIAPALQVPDSSTVKSAANAAANAAAKSAPKAVQSWREASLFTAQAKRSHVNADDPAASLPPGKETAPVLDARPSLNPTLPGFFLPLSGRTAP